jgi:hypothetical protein
LPIPGTVVKNPQSNFSYEPSQEGIAAINTLFTHMPNLKLLIMDYDINKQANANGAYDLLYNLGININKSNIGFIIIDRRFEDKLGGTGISETSEETVFQIMIDLAIEQYNIPIQEKGICILNVYHEHELDSSFMTKYKTKMVHVNPDTGLTEDIVGKIISTIAIK